MNEPLDAHVPPRCYTREQILHRSEVYPELCSALERDYIVLPYAATAAIMICDDMAPVPRARELNKVDR